MEAKLLLSATSESKDKTLVLDPGYDPGYDLNKLLEKGDHHEPEYGSIPMGKGDVQEKACEEADDGGCVGMSTAEKFTFISFCLSNFCLGAFFSVLGPFFPEEVKENPIYVVVVVVVVVVGL